jgi:hypothetical protein
MADHGERIATLEAEYAQVILRLNHLDECVDGVKVQAEENAALARKNERLWDRRWWIGLGFVAALIFLSGSGFVSLKEVAMLIAKALAK